MKSILITGATRNTGFAMAKKFASEGWAVFITSRDQEAAERAAEEIRQEFGTPCFGYQYDPGDIHSVDALLAKVKAEGYVLDSVVMNAAAQGLNTDPLTIDIDEWAAVIMANVVGGFNLARSVAREMVANNKQGTLVFIGSINYQNFIVQRSSYNASKGGILSTTKSLAMDLGQYGIRVNCLMPGPIYTERYDVLTEEVRRFRDAQVPIGRVSTAEDIAGGVWFLATELSGNMTGSGIIMDGGVHAANAGRF